MIDDSSLVPGGGGLGPRRLRNTESSSPGRWEAGGSRCYGPFGSQLRWWQKLPNRDTALPARLLTAEGLSEHCGGVVRKGQPSWTARKGQCPNFSNYHHEPKCLQGFVGAHEHTRFWTTFLARVPFLEQTVWQADTSVAPGPCLLLLPLV